MRIHIQDVLVGDRLIQNVFNASGLHVLSAYTVLTEDDIEKLHKHRIEYVDIAIRENLETIIDQRNRHTESVIGKVRPDYDSAVNGTRELFERVMEDGYLDVESVDEHYLPLAEHFRRETDIVSLLISLTNDDDYTYQHSVQVGMISFYLACWLGLPDEQAIIAGKAGYLHDIGKAQIDRSILNKPDKLTPQEFEIVKQHTTLGAQILQRAYPNDPLLADAALQHHERMDGSGYPEGLAGDQIHFISRLVSVADVYSAMISQRVYQDKRDLLCVLRELRQLSFNKLDPKIVQVFINMMIPNFIGKKLLLTTGETGIIVFNNPSDPFRPLVRLGDEFIDLSRRRDLDIESIFV